MNERENDQEDNNNNFQNTLKVFLEKNIAENEAINRLKIKSYLMRNVLYEGRVLY